MLRTVCEKTEWHLFEGLTDGQWVRSRYFGE